MKKTLIIIVSLLFVSCMNVGNVNEETPVIKKEKTEKIRMNSAADAPFVFAGALVVGDSTFEQRMGVHQFISWINVCGTDLYIGKDLMNAGDTITATCKGKLIGAKRIIACPDLEQCTDNALLSMPIYLDDPWDDAVDCPAIGDTIDFQYNGIPVFPKPTVTWDEFGATTPLLGFEYDRLCCLHRGDLNNDDIIDISDLVAMIDYMFLEGGVPICFANADLNNDTIIDVSDLMYLIDYMFLNGVSPVPCDN